MNWVSHIVSNGMNPSALKEASKEPIVNIHYKFISRGFNYELSQIGIDIAKNVFQLHSVDYAGNVKLRKRVLRAKLIKTTAQIAPCTIVMEACGGDNHGSRQFSKFGHQVKLISPQYVKPFVKTNKNDRNDATR